MVAAGLVANLRRRETLVRRQRDESTQEKKEANNSGKTQEEDRSVTAGRGALALGEDLWAADGAGTCLLPDAGG